MSQISDVGIFSQREQVSSHDIFSEVLGGLSSTIPDNLMGKFKMNKFKRSQYKFMSPFELFVNSIKNNPEMLKRLEVRDEELEFILRNAHKIQHIQYKNFAGMLFALRYYTLIISEGDTGTKLLSMLLLAKENSVPPFDVIRYYKILVESEILPEVIPIVKIKMEN